MLGYSDKHGLVICSTVDCSHTVDTFREAIRDVRLQHSIHGFIIQALKEDELTGVESLRVRKGVELLDDDVRVADDIALVVYLLRRGKVVRIGIDEVSCDEVVYGELYGKGLVRLNGGQILWRLELGRRHIRCGCDYAHGRSEIQGDHN